MSEQENTQDIAEEVVSEKIEDATESTEKIDTEGSLLKDESDAQRIYGYVKEVVDLFRPRVESGELTEYQVAEILSIATTGVLISVVPPGIQQLVDKETNSLVNYLYKQYQNKIKKKNLTFGAQVMAPQRFASYLISQANDTVDSIRQKVKAGKTPAEAVAAVSEETI